MAQRTPIKTETKELTGAERILAMKAKLKELEAAPKQETKVDSTAAERIAYAGAKTKNFFGDVKAAFKFYDAIHNGKITS